MEETDEDKSLFVNGGLFDSKTLAIALLVTSQALRDGTVDANAAAISLVRDTLWYLPKKSNPDEKGDSFTHLCATLSCDVFLSCQGFPSTGIPAFMDNVRNSFMEIKTSMTEVRNEGLFIVDVRNLHQAFYETLEQCKSHTQDVTGQDTCHLYNMTNNQFLDFVVKKLSEEFDTRQLLDATYNESLAKKQPYIEQAAQSVADGLDRIEITCCECGTFHDHVRRCSQCRLARYCSRECQKKSWKRGHNINCIRIKAHFDDFMADLELIDKAVAAQHDTDVKLETNPFLDYNLLKVLWIHLLADGITAFHAIKSQGCPGPSIAIFYQNLWTITHGGNHWQPS